jgi:putative ABC transport system substrate-binding protein
VSLKVSVIVTGGTAAARVARHMNIPIPVVIGAMTDPVGSGVAMSLAKPGGNITGLSLATGDDFGVKYLELLSALRPGLRRVAVLHHLPRPPELQAMQREAPRFGIELMLIPVDSKADLAGSFERIASQRTDAVVVTTDPFTFTERQSIVALAKASQLPVIYGLAAFVYAGGLMSYGPSLRAQWHRAATYVDKILKGAKAADLAIEQPTRFEFVINSKTASELGLKIPASLQVRVDRIVY